MARLGETSSESELHSLRYRGGQRQGTARFDHCAQSRDRRDGNCMCLAGAAQANAPLCIIARSRTILARPSASSKNSTGQRRPSAAFGSLIQRLTHAAASNPFESPLSSIMRATCWVSSATNFRRPAESGTPCILLIGQLRFSGAKQSLDCVRRRPSGDHTARSSAGPRDLFIAAGACSIVRNRDLGLTRPRLLVSPPFWRSQINGIARIWSEDRRITTPPTAERPRTYHVKPQYWNRWASVDAMALGFLSENT
jgi:hypothetical protein